MPNLCATFQNFLGAFYTLLVDRPLSLTKKYFFALLGEHQNLHLQKPALIKFDVNLRPLK